MKYQVIGSEAQVAMVDTRGSLIKARKFFKSTQFSNGHAALVVATTNTKRDAKLWLDRCNSGLAYVSGRLGRWITPTFVIIRAK